MSSWIVSKNHIDALVYWAMREGIIDEAKADEAGRRLWAENLASVAYAYPRDVSGGRPGPIGFTDDQVDAYTYRAPHIIPADDWGYAEGDPYSPACALHQVDCYRYQTCDHPGWAGSWAQEITDELREVLAEQVDGPVPANMPWGI